MPVPSLAVDLTRLVTRLGHASPSGIDRVDLAYARHVLAQPGARFGVVSTAFGPRVLDRAAASAIVEAAADAWSEDRGAEADPVYLRLSATLGGAPSGREADRGRSGRRRRRMVQVRTTLGLLRAGGPEALPRGSVYLHTSHLRLDKPERFDWLYDRPDLKPVFFVHDLIPISHPEYGRPGEAGRHAERMATVARHARRVIVNSADVGVAFLDHLRRHGLGSKPVTVAPLGVEPVFRVAGPAFAPKAPFFLVCGTIEPRKNHLLLLALWRDLAGRHGPATPRLVLVGRRGWEAENVVDMLERCPAALAHVTEVSGLSTHGLAALMRSATALLMPSFAEGYGLPVVEAAACGLPVVASDIAVHREVAGGFASFLDPLDGIGWRAKVEALGLPDSAERADMRGRLAGFAPPSWHDHFARVEAALAALA